jgi:hypothetical protein
MTFFAALLTIAATATAETTMVPTLDQEGRRGDIARLAKEKAMAKFDGADANKDGKLSKEEVANAFPYMSQNFDKLDTDKDGFLSWEEYIGHNRWPKK